MLQNSTVQIESLPCNLCNSHDISILATRSRSGAKLRTVICNQCGLVWSDPFPHNPRHFYEKDYRIEYKSTPTPKPNHILQAGLVALARHSKIKHLLTDRKTILDVGTGGGEFAYLLKLSGHDQYGIEPNKGYAEYSIAEYNLNVQIGFIQDSQFENNFFDIITIWHVLEHTENPYFVLLKLHSLLKPEGVLVVEVPNIEATCQSPKSTFHEAHLFNFNLNTLSRMAEKAGFVTTSHLFSPDAGNITLFFQKNPSNSTPTDTWTINDNAERITSIVQGHTNLKHYLTITPYKRFLNRMIRRVSEKQGVKNFENNKDLLNKLYQNYK